MAGEDLVVTTGLDLAGLQRDFRRGIGLADQFVSDLQRTLASRDLIGDLTPAGRKAGASLARGLSGSLTGIGVDLARSLDLSSAIATQGALAGREFTLALGAGIAGADDTLNRIAASVDLSAGGERAGTQFTSGIARVISAEAPSLRAAMSAAIVPTTVATDIGRLETVITAALSRLPVEFQRSGAASGAALITGIAGELVGARAVIGGFAQETSRAITAALTIGDVSGTGERAGRLLAVAVASGITAEAPRVRGALSTALVPTTLGPEISRITGVFATAGQEIVGLLGSAGTTGGQALTRNLLAEVGRGASVLRQLTTGAQIGVVVDAGPVRALVAEQQKLLTATTSATAAMRDLDAGVDAIDAKGIQQATAATRTLADAQREWLKEAQGGSVAAQALWQRQRDAAFQAGQQAKRNADEAGRAAQQEVAARAQVRAELQHDITALGQYGGQVDATSRRARQAWLQEANAIKQQAREVGVSTAELKRLDSIIDQTTQSFREQERAAQSAAAQIRNAGQSGSRFGPGVVDLRGFQRQADVARTGIARLVSEGGKLSALGTRLAPAMVGVGFALEGIALGGEKAEAGFRQVLRQIASFAPFFGPKGFIVAGAAAALNGVIALFEKSRDEMEETRKKFTDELRTMVESADATGIVNRLAKIELGSVTVDEQGNLKVIRGLKELEAAANKAKETINSIGDTKDFSRLSVLNQAKKDLKALEPELAQRRKQFQDLKNAINNLGTVREGKPLPTIVIDPGKQAQAAEKALRALRETVQNTTTAYEQLVKKPDEQRKVSQQMLPIYDRLNELVKSHAGSATEAANAYREMLATLKAIDGVQVELARRKLGGIAPDVDRPVLVTASIDRVKIPAAKQLEIPLEFDKTHLSDSLRRAIDSLGTAQTQETFAKIFGSRQQVSQATKTVNTETQNLTRTFRAAIDAELALAASGKLNVTRINEIVAAARALGIELDNTGRGTKRLSDTFLDVGDTAFAIADITSQFGGMNREVTDAIGSVGQLAGALSNLSQLKFSGPNGLFSSFNKFLEGLPVIGETISAVLNAQRSIIGAISGKTADAANAAITKSNTEAIRRLSQDVRGLGERIGDFSGASAALDTSSILNARRGTSGFGRGLKNVEDLDKELRAAGTSLSDLQRYAERFGITITDAAGRISAQGLNDLNIAMKVFARDLVTFSDSLKDQTFLADARREIFDANDATAVARDWLEQMKKFAPEIFAKFFGGADVTSKAGREAFEKGIRDVFDLAALNKLPAELIAMFGSAEDFIQFLLTADGALDGLADTANKLNSEMVNVVAGFRDFSLDRAVFNARQAPQFAPTMPPRPSPTPIPTGAGASVGTFNFSPTVILKDVGQKDVTQLSSELVAELKRKAGAIANPLVKQTVNLLPA